MEVTIVLFLHANVTRYFLILVSKGNLTPLLSYFLVKKYLLVGASSMLWTGQWISQWVRDVCMSHQSDRVYYKQPIKFIVLKVNGMWEDSIPIQFRTAIFILLWKRRKYLFPHFLWVMLRILVMDEMSLEVWDSAWANANGTGYFYF